MGFVVENTYVPARTRTGYGEFNLWGTLREVVVGTNISAMAPDNIKSVIDRVGSVMDPQVLEALKNAGSKRLLKDLLPAVYDSLEEENNELIALYKRYNVHVHLLRPATDRERLLNWGAGGCMQMFAAEPLWVVGRLVFENQWGADVSRAQVMAVRDHHQPYIDADSEVIYVNAPTTSPENLDYIYEGGDVLNLGDGNVIVATSHSSTNRRGAEWVARILRLDGYKPHLIDLPNIGIHHLFAVMCVAGPGIAIACRDSFPNGVPEPMKDWDIIWATREEARLTGPCGTMINPKTIIMPAETPRLNEEVAKRGITPETVPLRAHAMFAGGNRCMTSVIRRDLA